MDKGQSIPTIKQKEKGSPNDEVNEPYQPQIVTSRQSEYLNETPDGERALTKPIYEAQPGL